MSLDPTDQGGFDEEILNLDEVADVVEYEPAPPGIYEAVCESAEHGYTQAGDNQKITLRFRLQNNDLEEANGKVVYLTSTWHHPFGLTQLKKLVAIFAPGADAKSFLPRRDYELLMGGVGRLQLGISTYNNQRRNDVKEIHPAGADYFS